MPMEIKIEIEAKKASRDISFGELKCGERGDQGGSCESAGVKRKVLWCVILMRVDMQAARIDNVLPRAER